MGHNRQSAPDNPDGGDLDRRLPDCGDPAIDNHDCLNRHESFFFGRRMNLEIVHVSLFYLYSQRFFNNFLLEKKSQNSKVKNDQRIIKLYFLLKNRYIKNDNNLLKCL